MYIDLPRLPIATLPTPIEHRQLATRHGVVDIAIKRDDLSGDIYGGNKVRKLEYLLQRARQRKAKRIATFGTVGSNHAVATAMYARSLGFDCTCFLSNQFRTPACARALNVHVAAGTEIIRYGGNREQRIALLRQHLRGRRAQLIPPGGSSWIGTASFVNAGLEFASQVTAGDAVVPARIYVANGTMGTAAGLALGLAIADLPTEVQAVRVTDDFVANPEAMRRLLEKTAMMLRARDASLPADLSARARYAFREGFFAGGYAKTDDVTDRAIAIAKDEFGLTLEGTYTGKAVAAMLHDLESREGTRGDVLFWNTYNSRPVDAGTEQPADVSGIPEAFLRYFY